MTKRKNPHGATADQKARRVLAGLDAIAEDLAAEILKDIPIPEEASYMLRRAAEVIEYRDKRHRGRWRRTVPKVHTLTDGEGAR